MFGQRLQQLHVAGLSQSELAQKVGVSIEKLQEWEVYGGDPGKDALRKLAAALDVQESKLAAGLAESQEMRKSQVVSTPREKPQAPRGG